MKYVKRILCNLKGCEFIEFVLSAMARAKPEITYIRLKRGFFPDEAQFNCHTLYTLSQYLPNNKYTTIRYVTLFVFIEFPSGSKVISMQTLNRSNRSARAEYARRVCVCVHCAHYPLCGKLSQGTINIHMCVCACVHCTRYSKFPCARKSIE